MTYLVVGVIVAAVVFLAVWFAAILQSGLVLGGTIGLIPAYVGGIIAGVLWPLALGLAYFFRVEIGEIFGL